MPFAGLRNHAAVLWRSVSGTAQENADKVDSGMLLGMVIAHELGHLVMGSGTHGPGIMSANWLRGLYSHWPARPSIYPSGDPAIASRASKSVRRIRCR